jgi:hypothetical protein
MTSTKLARTLAAMTVAAAIAAPAAGARPIDVPPPPSSIAAGAGMEYGELRAPEPAPQPIVAEPSGGGFDWPSAAIGGVAVAGLSLASMAALGTRGRRVARVEG